MLYVAYEGAHTPVIVVRDTDASEVEYLGEFCYPSDDELESENKYTVRLPKNEHGFIFEATFHAINDTRPSGITRESMTEVAKFMHDHVFASFNKPA